MALGFSVPAMLQKGGAGMMDIVQFPYLWINYGITVLNVEKYNFFMVELNGLCYSKLNNYATM